MSAREHVLVDGQWAEAHLNHTEVVFVEVDERTEDYWTSHLPGAVALDWRAELQDPLRRDLVSRDRFGELLSQKGIGEDDTVVLYGGNNNWFAAYAYWYFKLFGHADVRLLDGGRKKWELEGRPLTSSIVSRTPTTYRAKEMDRRLRAYRDEVLASLGSVAILDVRSPAEFDGTLLAPPTFPQEQPQVRGHIPTAVNVPWARTANEDGSFKTDAELIDLYTAAGLPLDDEPTIVYCRIGERSAHSWFVLHELLGQNHVKNYDGSWVEYGSLVGVPVEKASAPR